MQRVIRWSRLNREFLGLSVFLFVLGVVLGCTLHSSQIDHLVAGSVDKIRGINQMYVQTGSKPWVLALLILANNLQIALLTILLGTLLAIFPVVLLLLNGLSIGYIVTKVSVTGNTAIWKLVLAGVLPHGMFEIPAFLLAAAIGMKLGASWIRPMRGSSPWRSYVMAWRESLRVIPFVISLFIIAAAIEGFITPVLMRMWG
ncbi:MAG: hypothetical protein JWN30_1969 [Bacilli bacterium]|nr:hypothetical protein [Bacilli bacterium]